MTNAVSQPRSPHLGSADFQRIARSIAYIEAHWREQPSLDEVAGQARLSRYHFDRLFHQWAGITPKGYLQYITGSIAKAGLMQKTSLLETSLAVGLSGPSRLHDLIIKLEAMSPAEAARGGEGVSIDFGVAPSPFGLMLAGRTGRGVCHIGFVEDGSQQACRAELQSRWPRAVLQWRPEAAAALAALIWPTGSSGPPGRSASGGPARLSLWVRGSAFQLQVWRALLALPPGQHSSYGAIASQVGRPAAARAVGAAVGANPVAWLIPCHRVLRAGGQLGGYHWGTDRKRAMLAWERVQGTSLAVNG
jgi:AraC family transcriptional regulator of adaptative response/methylated-DNA-[protein]-cysteine methyltransferase